MPGQKLYRVGGVPASPKLVPISQSVTPEQGRYYDQSALSRMLLPLRNMLRGSRPMTPKTGAGVADILKAVATSNRRVPGKVGKVFPSAAYSVNSPQRPGSRKVSKA